VRPCGADLCFKVSENPELQAVGGIVLLTQAPGKKIIVQRMSDTAFVALSAVSARRVQLASTARTSSTVPAGSSFNAATGAVLNGLRWRAQELPDDRRRRRRDDHSRIGRIGRPQWR
jgi:hypothetical protein